MKKSFKERITSLGLSYSKEMIMLFIINILIIALGAVAYIFLKEIYVAIIGGIILLAANFVYLSRYSSLEKGREKEHLDELISLLSYFELFIDNGNNVYTAFKMLIPYASNFMDEAISNLLIQIDADKTVAPYIAFAQRFPHRIIESLMLSIYQMVDNGENSGQFIEFDNLFSSISKEHQQMIVEEKRRKLSSLDSWPLFASGAITLILAFSILGIIGDYINVL